MLDFRNMPDDYLFFPQLFTNIGARSALQSLYLASIEPAIDTDADTQPLSVPLPEPDLTDADIDDDPMNWPLFADGTDRAKPRPADAADGYTNDSDLLPFEV